jgi:hypothetical protein
MFLSKKKRKLIALKLKEEGPRPKSSKKAKNRYDEEIQNPENQRK